MIIHVHVDRNTKEKGYARHGNSVFNVECFVVRPNNLYYFIDQIVIMDQCGHR